MLAGHEIPLFDFTLFGKTPQTLQEKFLPFPAAQAANCFTMSCQSWFSFATRYFAYRLDAPPFRRTATVMRNRRNVLDGIDVHTDAGKRADG
jgi:hypothetical protein